MKNKKMVALLAGGLLLASSAEVFARGAQGGNTGGGDGMQVKSRVVGNRHLEMKEKLEKRAEKKDVRAEVKERKQFQYQEYKSLGEAVKKMKGEMNQHMERLRKLEQSNNRSQDKYMYEETKKIRERMNRMINELHDTAEMMERVQKRVGQ